MPWEERTVIQMRQRFVEEYLNGQKTKSQLCREYGISRPTGDKWIERYQNERSVANRSKCPHNIARKTDPEVEKIILEYRRKHPAIGAQKIQKILCNKGYQNIPSPRTVNNILNRNGMITREAGLAVKPYTRFQKECANKMWQADYKGHFAMRDGIRCHPLNIIDDCSRFNICSRGLYTETFKEIKPVMISLFEEYGMPEIFLCDNGHPWGNAQSTCFTSFEVWLMELGILTIHGRVRHPQTQGKDESFNRSMTRELLRYHEFENMEEAQRYFDEYRTYYNTERPHFALNLETPIQHYTKSQREYQGEIKEWEYKESGSLRRVRGNGSFNWNGQGYYLSEALIGKDILVHEDTGRKVIELYFRQFHIGCIDIERRVYKFKKIYLTEHDPRREINGAAQLPELVI